MSGRKTSSVDRLGPVLAGQARRTSVPRWATSTLKPYCVGEIEQDARVVRVIFDDEEAQVTGLEGETIVGDRFGRPEPPCGVPRNAASAGSGRRSVSPNARARPGRRYFMRQIEREGAAAAGGAAQVDLAAQEVGELAADGEAEAGAAVAAAGAGIGLLEGLEDDLLLFGGNADAGVADLEARPPTAPDEGSGDRGSSRPRYASTREATPPLFGELEGVGEQVLEDLLQALGVGDDAVSSCGSTSTSK